MISSTTKAKIDDRDANAGGKRVASIFSILFYVLLFFALYQSQIGITKIYPKEIEIEIIPDKEVMSVPQGVARRNPLQKPVPNPPIENVPGVSAPQSAVVAASNQSTLPKPRPETKPADIADQGDVETTTAKPINERSLFSSNTNGEEEDNTSNNINQSSLYSGVGHDNQETRTADTPIGPDHRQLVTANLIGRSIVGSLPAPAYNSQNEGKVVVEITVDQNGNVTKANATGRGTTVQDAKLWNAAVEAAKKAKFNVKKDAPIFQIGTITYVFKLN